MLKPNAEREKLDQVLRLNSCVHQFMQMMPREIRWGILNLLNYVKVPRESMSECETIPHQYLSKSDFAY